MTSPLSSTQDMLALLELVDISRARATFVEDQYRAEISSIYANRAISLRLEQQDDESAPVLTAAVLASVVSVIRRSLAAGTEEGVRFAQEQFQVLGVPSELLEDLDLASTDLGDKLVKDFLSGQTDVVRSGDKPSVELLDDLQRRAQLAVLSALHVARGSATNHLLAASSSLINSSVYKLWVTRFDLVTPPCELCTRLHGKYVLVDGSFDVPDSEPSPYFSPLTAPPRHPQCRCSILVYFPEMLSDDPDTVTPLSMQAYASWALDMSDEDRSDYVAATVVRVRGYTRVVDGKIQHVSGYYYNIQTGQKIPEGQWGNIASVKEVSAKQAKSMAKVSKTANAGTPQGGAPDLSWKPGTYRIDLPNSGDDVQVVVHQDGSSTSIYKGKTEDADPAKTAQFLSLHKAKGSVQKISDDPDVPDSDGPGPVLEPDAELNKKTTLAEGWYVFSKHKTYGGVRVDADGSGRLFFKDFKKSLPVKETAINQISNGHLGKFDEVDESDFKSDWHKDFDGSKAGGAKEPSKSASSADNAPAGVNVPGQATTSADASSKSDTPSAPEKVGVPEAPDGGPGGVVKDGPSLFSVGVHSVQIEEGSQVYKSGKSKDTLYVLQPDGDLIKYNPQGSGVQAKRVGSSDSPSARAQLLSGLDNVTDDGVSIKDSSPLPGTGKALVGGFELTSGQLGSAIAALSSNPSGNVSADLKKIGSPLAAGKFHEVAAPYKAYYNNKTKPALIAALKKAHQQTGATPLSEASAVSHLTSDHGLGTHHSQLGLNDHEAIHDAIHAVDPSSSGHTHEPAAPGFISLGGVPTTPQAVAEAISALKKSPVKETGIKKPLKSIGSPLSGINLQDLVDASLVTDQYKGSNGKVHYGKIKPALIALLQDMLDKHQTKNPPIFSDAPSVPPSVKFVEGVAATEADIFELQGFFAGVDFDQIPLDEIDFSPVSHNPLALHVNWSSLADSKYGDATPAHELNSVLHDVLNSYLDKPVPFSQVPSIIEVPEDDSPSVKVGDVVSTTSQLKQLKTSVDAAVASDSLNLPASSDFAGKSPDGLAADLGIPPLPTASGLKQALSDALQNKIDNAVLQEALPPISSSPSTPSKISVGGQQVTKQDLLDAVSAVQSSTSTSVKAPLKSIGSPLAKVDIKSYVESQPESAPFKGSNGKVHYGKLKAAVAAVLQAKAEDLSSLASVDVSPDTSPVVTSTEHSLEKSPVDGLDADIDAASPFPDPGLYSSAGGMSLKVFGDGTAVAVNNHTGQSVPFNDSSAVKSMLDQGSWTKLSDSPVDSSAVYVDGVESGFYAGGPGGVSFSVYPDGTVLVETSFSTSLVSVAVAKPYLQAQGISPSSLKTDLPDWIVSSKKDPNGFLIGSYSVGYGDYVTVSEQGSDVSPKVLAHYLLSGDASFVPEASHLSSGTESSSAFASLLDKAKNANVQDPWLTTTTTISQGFQKSIKLNDTVYKTGSKAGNGWSTGAPPAVQHYKFTPDGSVQSVSGSGHVLKEWSQEDLVSLLDGVYEGPSVAAPVPLPPDTVSDLWPDGTWQGNPVGTWTTSDGVLFDITSDGPDTDFLHAAELDVSDLQQMIDSGDVTWVPSLDSPVVSTPTSLFDADAPVLHPFMVVGETNLSLVQKPQLLAAAQQWAKDSGFDGVAAQHLSALKKSEIEKWLTHWSRGEWDKAYVIESANVKKHKAASSHPGSPLNSSNVGGFTQKKMPPLVAGEVPAGTSVSVQVPNTYYKSWDMELVDAYMLEANMQNPTGLTNSLKLRWVYNHARGNKIETDSLSGLAQKNLEEGRVYSYPILPPAQVYAPGLSVPLPDDFPTLDFSKSSALGWTNSQLDHYLNHVGRTKNGVTFLLKQSPETKADLVALHAVAAAPSDALTFKDPVLARQQMLDLLNKIDLLSQFGEKSTTDFIQAITKLANKTFTKDKLQPPLKGHSTIYHVTDEKGMPFLFKVAPEKFRAEVEHAAHELAALSGLEVADSILGTFEGNFGQFQAKIPSQSTLFGVPASELPLSAAKDLLRAHVQDWVTSNDDAHDDTFLLTPDGQRVAPIDIARAFVRFGQPGAMSLKLGSLSNWETPYYQKIYDRVLSGGFSDSDVDELYRTSLDQARRTQNVSDESWSSVMQEGLKNRTNFSSTSADSLPELIEHALARKHTLESDFESFWDDIYSRLGRAKPVSGSSLSKWTYSGFSTDFLQHVESAGNHGASTFFGGVDLEDGHFLAQVLSNPSSGGKELHLTAQLLQSADADLRAWLVGNLSGDISGVSQSSSTQKAALLESLGVTKYSQWVVSAAKTVSYHHSIGDTNYTSSHMSNFENLKTQVNQNLIDIESGNWPDVIKDWPEAQTEYMQLLYHYFDQISNVEKLIDFDGQSSDDDFPEFEFTMPSPKVLSSPIKKDTLKVIKIKSYHDKSDLVDGKLVLSGSKFSDGQTGYTYQVTLSDGIQIEYRSWYPNDGVQLSQQGTLRIKVRNYDGSTSGVSAARSALEQMGLKLRDASESDLELLYYRHLFGVLSDRADAKIGKMKDVVSDVSANLPGGKFGTPALSAAEELKRWRAAWSRLDPSKFNTFLSEKRWLPRFSRVSTSNPSLRAGRPWWERFDYDESWLVSQTFPSHSLSNGDDGALSIVQSGALLSTESRSISLGNFYDSISSQEDQTRGSAAFVFARQNYPASYYQVFLSNKVLKRTSNYAYGSDLYGKASRKITDSYFDPQRSADFSGASNELMIKHAVSVLDDVELIAFSSTTSLNAALQYLRDHGVTSIRGLPIESRLVLMSASKTSLEALQKHALTWKEEVEL